jgi:hypothetical protein
MHELAYGIYVPDIIILEGCDGSGKTTLANWLRDELGYHIVKTGPPAPGASTFKSYTTALLEAVEAAVYNGHRTVFDRHYLGETIYGPLLRGRDTLGILGRDLIEGIIRSCGAVVVICAPPWEVLVKGWSGKDDLLKRESQLKQVNDAYLAEAARLGLEVYDWTSGNDLPQSLFQEVVVDA